MPYIRPDLRAFIDSKVEDLILQINSECMSDKFDEDDRAAIITYIFFKILKRYYSNGSWCLRSKVFAILGSCKDEFTRRFLHPYEDQKIKENGDA